MDLVNFQIMEQFTANSSRTDGEDWYDSKVEEDVELFDEEEE